MAARLSVYPLATQRGAVLAAARRADAVLVLVEAPTRSTAVAPRLPFAPAAEGRIVAKAGAWLLVEYDSGSVLAASG